MSKKRWISQRGWLCLIDLIAWLNLIAAVVVLLLIRVVSDRWWLGTVLTYVPKAPLIAPAAILLLILLVKMALRGRGTKSSPDDDDKTCVVKKRTRFAEIRILGLCLANVGLITFPVMDLQFPQMRATRPNQDAIRITIVSYNVGQFRPDFRQLLDDVSRLDADVVAFQEADDPRSPLLSSHFKDWHTLHVDEFFVASKYPLQLVGICEPPPLDRETAMAVEVRTPDGPFRLYDIHLISPRPELRGVSLRSVWNGSSANVIEEVAELRKAEATATRAFVGQMTGIPTIVVGDFNAPTSSSIFRAHWGEFTNAFDVAGTGFGYTAPLHVESPLSVFSPWLRIDHILLSADWAILDCFVADRRGSDHRPIIATVALRRSAAEATSTLDPRADPSFSHQDRTGSPGTHSPGATISQSTPSPVPSPMKRIRR